MIAGFTTPTSGAIYYNGDRVTQPSALRTMVFQDYALFPWFTVEQNVAFGLVAKGTTKHQRRQMVDELLEMVGHLDFAHSYPHHLSGGLRTVGGPARGRTA